MEYAINEAGILLEEVTYINAHGTSTHHNDLFETRAIKMIAITLGVQMKSIIKFRDLS